MKHQHRKLRSFSIMGCTIALLLMCGWVAGGRVAAAGPLPLPDMLIYGMVSNATGDPLESGTLRALRNGQTVASAEIQALSGADYNFMLVVPMGMYAADSTERNAKLTFAGDVLAFTVDGQPVYYQDPLTSLTVDQLRVPTGVAGTGLVLDLAQGDAMRYLMGDANANGARNGTDAMLALKYDIGLITGVTSFPPGPNTVYLPLCDIVENGRCDSSDALRILQCDAGLTHVTCPMQTIPAVPAAPPAPTAPNTDAGDIAPTQGDPGSPIQLQVSLGESADDGTFDVRVLLSAGADRFGAGTFALQYDPALLTPTACTADPGGVLDIALCNLDQVSGVLRFNAVDVDGAADGVALATLSFQSVNATEPTPSTPPTPALTLVVDSITDVDGDGMAWRIAPADDTQIQHQFFLPVIVATGEIPANQPAQEAQQFFFLPSIIDSAPGSTEQSPNAGP